MCSLDYVIEKLDPSISSSRDLIIAGFDEEMIQNSKFKEKKENMAMKNYCIIVLSNMMKHCKPYI